MKTYRTAAALAVVAIVVAAISGCSSSGSTSPEESTPWYTNATWTRLADFTPDAELGTSMVWAGGDYIYALRGGADEHQGEFWRYQLSTDTWEQQIDNTPFNPYWACSMVWTGGDYLYATQGNGSDGFYRYTISTGDWDHMASFPEWGVRYNGQSLAWPGSGDYIYAAKGNSEDVFTRYRISTDEWEYVEPVPQRMYYGSSIAYGEDGTIFAATDSLGFYKYDTSTDSWSSAADAPGAVNLGGWLSRDGNGSLFLTEGNGSSALWRYDLDDDSWESMMDTPSPVGSGGCTVSDGSALYVLVGDGSSEFWVLRE